MTGEFDCVRHALDRWEIAGRAPVLWLRDDDAVAATAELATFRVQCEAAGVAPLMAVIPGLLAPSLAPALSGWDGVRVAVHGWKHVNRAQSGAKKSEFPDGDRHHAATVIAEARRCLRDVFPEQMVEVFVPPWNRIGSDVAANLPELGFRWLSTYASAHEGRDSAFFAVRNTHVDLIDWHAGRVGKEFARFSRELATVLDGGLAQGRLELGILTHHLDHDPTALQTLDRLFDALGRDGRARWFNPSCVFSSDAGPAAGAE